MTAAVRQLLASFESLPLTDQHEATMEILRRASVIGDVSDEGLVEAADELFRQMDTDEAQNAAS